MRPQSRRRDSDLPPEPATRRAAAGRRGAAPVHVHARACTAHRCRQRSWPGRQGGRRILGLAEVHYAHEPRPGIAAARNRAVSESRAARILVFLDDDERPGQDWLAALLRTWCDTRADAVAGRVIPVFERTPSRWIVAGGFFERRSLPTGTVIPTAPAGNLLLDLQAVRERGLRFDERLGLSGGEDTRFTSELNATGAASSSAANPPWRTWSPRSGPRRGGSCVARSATATRRLCSPWRALDPDNGLLREYVSGRAGWRG